MTGRTHDLAAFTALTYVFVTSPLPEMSLATAITAVGANFVGGLFPDLDKSTGGLYNHIRGGSIFGRLISPIMGGHRLISHSILGLFIFGYLSKLGLMRLGSILLVDMNIVWIAFMVGVVSHLLADMLTKEGVPLLFPLPWEIGIPPFRFLRIKTGGLIEKSVVFPGLMLASGAMMTNGYDKILEFLKSL